MCLCNHWRAGGLELQVYVVLPRLFQPAREGSCGRGFQPSGVEAGGGGSFGSASSGARLAVSFFVGVLFCTSLVTHGTRLFFAFVFSPFVSSGGFI